MAKKTMEFRCPPLFKWQQDVFTCLIEHPKASTIAVKAPRQRGKSVMDEMLLLYTAINRPGSISYIVEPTFSQAMKVWTEITEAIEGTAIFYSKNSSFLSIFLRNKSKIYCKSGEQRENLRGFTASGIVILDEAAYLSDDVIQTIMPWVDAHQAPIIMTSSPRVKAGMFYEFYMKGLGSTPSIYSFDWSEYDTSALLPPDRLEFYRQTLAANVFWTEYLGRFLENKSNVFGNFEDVLSNNYDKTDHEYYFGIDWGAGTGNDRTAIAIFNSQKQMVKLEYFSDKDETDTITYIGDLIKEYNPKKVTVETNSIGQVFFGLLKKEVTNRHLTTSVEGFSTNNDSKNTIVNELQVAIQNKTVQLLNDPELILEMSSYERTISKSGKFQYNGKTPVHDDAVIGTMIALHNINSNKGVYCIGTN